MKTYTDLYQEIYSWKNLLEAFHKAKKNKSDRWYVMEFENNLASELEKLQDELLSFTYKPSQLKKMIIRDPKTRTIHIAEFRDRVVHHALVNIIGPILSARFIYDSFASQKGKGVHKAVMRFTDYARKVSNGGKLVSTAFNNNHVKGYCLKADIRHYFQTVDHKILLQIIGKKIKDENVLWLIKIILESFEEGKGMPLGNYTSQFFANVYLNELDYFVKHNLRAKYYIRYVDDFVIIHQNKEILLSCKEKIVDFLKTLQLTIHPEKTQILPLRNGITFLGYRIFYRYKLLRKSNWKKFQRKFHDNKQLYLKGEISMLKLRAGITGWEGYAQLANAYNLRKTIWKELDQARHEKYFYGIHNCSSKIL